MSPKSITTVAEDVSSKFTVHNFYRAIGFIFVIIGAGFYVGWSIPYGTWTDVGVYGFVVPLVVLGILTIVLADEKERLKNQEDQ